MHDDAHYRVMCIIGRERERETKDPRKTRYVFSRMFGDSSAYVWHAQAKQYYIDLVTIQLQDIKHHEND